MIVNKKKNKKTNNLYKLFALSLAGSVCLGLSGCGKNTQTLPETTSVSETAVEEIVVEEIKPKSLLSNEETDRDLTQTRPIAVMFENSQNALPHYGLAQASVVYESVVEGGITRYMGLFDDYENFERLGNIRSARPYFIYLASEYDAIFINHGQSEEGLSVLNSGVVDNYNGLYSLPGFYRSTDKKMPHNSYLESKGLLDGLADKKISTTYENPYPGHFAFNDEENPLSEGVPAEYIKLYYFTNKPSFVYDAATMTYKRYAFGDVEADALSAEGISFKNLILQNVDSWVEDAEGHMGVALVGTGTGKYITNGRVIDITWKKDSNTDRTVYYTMDGAELRLNTGKTYIALIENSNRDKNEILEKYEQQN